MPINKILEIQLEDDASLVEPVDLTMAKSWLRIDSNDDDTLLTSLITQCRKRIEKLTTTSLVVKRVIIFAYIYEPLVLPYGPVDIGSALGVLSVINIINESSAETLTSGTDYTFVGVENAELHIGVSGKFQIQFFTKPPIDIEQFQHAILTEMAFRYENRGDDIQNFASNMPGVCHSTMEIIKPLKRYAWV